jgi:hypothetical protein
MAKERTPHEAKHFEEIYIDETHQNGPGRYLVLGGLVMLPSHRICEAT